MVVGNVQIIMRNHEPWKLEKGGYVADEIGTDLLQKIVEELNLPGIMGRNNILK